MMETLAFNELKITYLKSAKCRLWHNAILMTCPIMKYSLCHGCFGAFSESLKENSFSECSQFTKTYHLSVILYCFFGVFFVCPVKIILKKTISFDFLHLTSFVVGLILKFILIAILIMCESLVTKCQSVEYSCSSALVAVSYSNFVRNIRKYLENNSMSNKCRSLRCTSYSPVLCLGIKSFLASVDFCFFNK